MATGTKFRNFARMLDASDVPLWIISSSGKLVYLSAGVETWLGIDPESLLDRHCVAGTPLSDDPLDAVAASMSPPPGLRERGTASLKVQPPSHDGRRIESMEVRFVRIGKQDPMTIAVAGEFDDRVLDHDLHDAVAVRNKLDAWRKHHRQLAAIATAGVSNQSRRLRSRLQVASTARCHIAFFGPPGNGAESIALRVHQSSAPGEPIVTVDGPLMDAELLDAMVMPLIHRLADANDATATALIRGLDEMPSEAQNRLAELVASYSPRLRLLCLCGECPEVMREPLDRSETEIAEVSLEEDPRGKIHPGLQDVVSTLTVTCYPLAQRVEDIPLLAAAMVDARHAAGEGTAQRLSRAALDALVSYPWPKNFDELSDAMRHAVRTANRESIGVEHLPLAIRSYRTGETNRAAKFVGSLDEAVGRYQQRLINEAVEAADGNRAEAARRLGISRARLLRKLDEADGKSD